MNTTYRLPNTSRTYSARCWTQRIVYLLIVLLVIPPQLFFASTASAAGRTSTLTHSSAMESLQNPQFSSAQANRFLYTHGPSALVGGGGSAFSSPMSRGYRRFSEPETVSLVDGGSVQWGETDLTLPGVGSPLTFQRIYRSTVESYDGPLGQSWDFSWNKRLFKDTTHDEIDFYEMGRVDVYDTSGASIVSPAGRYDTLAASGSDYTRTSKWGIVETYEPDGATNWYRLASVEGLNGNTISFTYDGSDRLTTVTDTLSQDVTIAYDGSDRISTITDHGGRVWKYVYVSGNLASVRTPLVDEAGTDHDFTAGKTTRYEYDGDDRLDEVLLPEDTTTGTYRWEYVSASGHVTKAWRNGHATVLTHDTSNDLVTVEDRCGETVEYAYEDVGSAGTNFRITERRVEYGVGVNDNWETEFEYNSDNEVVKATFPNDNRIEYAFDSDGNVTSVELHDGPSDLSPITWTYTYTTNSRLATLTDPNNRVWNYEYDTNSNLTRRAAPAVTLPSGITTTDNNGNGTYDGTIAETWTYNSDGLVTSATDAYGTVTDYTYASVNSKDAYVDGVIRDAGAGKLNLTRSYAHDSYGNVTSTTDPEGNTTTYVVNDLNQVISTTEPLSILSETFYDGNNRVIKTERESDVTEGTDPFVVERQYDQIGNLTALIEDIDANDNLTKTYAYDPADRLTKTTSPEGNVTFTEYDARDLVTKTSRWIGTSANASLDSITTTVYDDNGLRTSVTDAEGNATFFAYDGYDRLTKVTQPEGNYRVVAYDAAGNVTESSSYDVSATKLAETTTYYDEANRVYKTDVWAKKADLTTNIGSGAQSKTIWRDELGRVVEFAGDICGCSLYETVYDAVGRVVTKKDPMGATDSTRNLQIIAYDKNGNVTERTRIERSQDTGIEADKTIVVEMEYDTRNRMTKRRDKIGASSYADTVYSFGERDQLTKVVDGEGDEMRYEYNQQLWKKKDTLENGTADVITEYVYDDDGRMITYKAKNSTTGDQLTEYTYDRLGRRTKTTWPDAGETIQTYDRNGNALAKTDPNGTVVTCAYDDNNRLTAKDLTLATNVKGLDDIDYEYDGLNRLISADASEPSGFTSVVERTYNTLGKIESETQVIDNHGGGSGRTITYDWDIDGQKTAVTYPVSGDVVSYTRDALDRIDVISREGIEIVDYAYNGSRVIEKAMPGSEAEYTYDAFGRMTNVLHKDTSSGDTLLEFDYGYDEAHQVIYQDKHFYDDVAATRITGNTYDLGDQYAYDGAKRLTKVLRGVPTAQIATAMATNLTNGDYEDEVEYTYDQTGNRTELEVTPQGGSTTSTTYAHNKVNEMTTEGGSTRTYSANGEDTGTSNSLKYNADGQMTTYTDGSDTWNFKFDALGRRVQRKKSGLAKPAHRFYYDGIHCVEHVKKNLGEVIQKKFVYGSGVDELLEYVDTKLVPDKAYYAHSDRLGSVMLLVDNGGAIKESYRYEEFGGTVIVDGTFTEVTSDPHRSPKGNPYRYTGRRQDIMISATDAEDDWYYSRARNLRVEVGRFIVQDSMVYVDGSNMYNYARSSPVNEIDPLGTFSLLVGASGGVYGSGDAFNSYLECMDQCVGNPSGISELEDEAGIPDEKKAAALVGQCARGVRNAALDNCLQGKGYEDVADIEGLIEGVLDVLSMPNPTADDCVAAGLPNTWCSDGVDLDSILDGLDLDIHSCSWQAGLSYKAAISGASPGLCHIPACHASCFFMATGMPSPGGSSAAAPGATFPGPVTL